MRSGGSILSASTFIVVSAPDRPVISPAPSISIIIGAPKKSIVSMPSL